MIGKEAIKELAIILQRDYGKDIDEAKARSMAVWFVDYFKLIIDIEKEKL